MQEINAEILTGNPLQKIVGIGGVFDSLAEVLDSELATRGQEQISGAKYEFTPYILGDYMLRLSGIRFVETDGARLEQKAKFKFVMDERDNIILMSLGDDGSLMDEGRAFFIEADSAIIEIMHQIALERTHFVN